MNCSPTLTADEFKDIHNARCELHSIVKSIDGIVHPSVQERLEKVIDLLGKGLSGAYAQDDAAADAQDERNRVASEMISATTIWSVDGNIDFMKPHPFIGARQLTYIDHWGQDPVVVLIQGALWIDLYRAADKAIRMSGDTHHIFIESFSLVIAKNPTVLRLGTGS